jgi:outer membrane protein, multidrug efflux system
MRRKIPTCAFILGLAGCTVGPDFTPPKPPEITKWTDRSAQPSRPASPVSTQTNPDPNWWNGFKDPTLPVLIQRAISGNLTLQQAVVRNVEAQQGEVSAHAVGLPAVNGSGRYMRDQLGLRGLLLSQGVPAEVKGLGAPGSTLNTLSPGLGTSAISAVNGALNQFSQPVNLFQYGLSSSWELDLFGRVRRSVEQAKASAEAQVEATNDALVMLEGQVAEAYVQLRGAQALTITQQEHIRSAREGLDLTQKRQREGLSTDPMLSRPARSWRTSNTCCLAIRNRRSRR